MSASLVGSEMCIRDRCPSPWGLRPEGRGVCFWSEGAELQRKRALRSVSYTHLTLPTICSV
eukprot:7430475-Alexandrium_andersonii.AAC.1